MDDMTKELYLQWIISDYIPFEYKEKSYFISTPSREDRMLSERIFISVYKKAEKEELLTDKEITKLLLDNKMWNQEKEDNLNKLIKDIDDIKVWIFENYLNTSKRNQFRKALKDTQDYIFKLNEEKQTFDFMSAKSVASYAKYHYLTGNSIFKKKNQKALNNWWSLKDDDIIQQSYLAMADYYLADKEYRELARSPSWRNVWAVKKAGGSLFGKPVVDLSPQQKQLIVWSQVYDSVYKSSECPSDSIIEDDDALDGWMITQKRNRDRQNNKDIVEKSLTNEKIRNSEQIYVMCDPTYNNQTLIDNPSQVYNCNDFEGKVRFNQIINQVNKDGVVKFMELKDTQKEIYRRANEMKG